MKTPKEPDYTDKEADRLRDETIKRMLATPPTPHKPKGGREPKPAPEAITDR